MVQRLLTKYGLSVHLACICLYPVGVLSQSRVSGLVPLFWLVFVAAEWLLLLPSVKRGETLADARRRVLHAMAWDPFVYIGIALVALLAVQCLNSGLELVYLPDADIWQLSDPPVAWAPSAVERCAAVTQLALFTACVTVGITLRIAVGKAAKRALLQFLARASGAVAVVGVALALQGCEPYAALAAGGGLTSAGTFFGFWLLLGIGLFIEARSRDPHTPRLLFLLAGLGNLLGMLFFASPPMVVVFSVFAAMLLLYGTIYLAPLVPKSVQLKLFACTLFCVGGIAVSLGYLFPQNPVAEKLMGAWPVDAYWDALAARNSVRAEAAVTVWQQHPWAGVGADGFYHYVALAVKQEQWGLVEQDRALALSDGTQFLCEYGVFGAGLLLAAVVALLIPLCYRARLLWQHKGHDAMSDRTFPFRLSPVVTTGVLAVVLCCLESFMASPFRMPALLLSWTCVLAAMPAFLPERGA